MLDPITNPVGTAPTTPSGPVLVASDLHLGAVAPANLAAFHDWLDRFGPTSRQIVLNGDLFDFWFEYRSVIPRGATRTLGRLAALVDAGVRIDFVGGNHDWWGGSFLTDEIGLHVHRDPVRLKLAGFNAYVAHGDGLGNGDLRYRALRLLLRGRLTRWGFRWLHPDLGAALAQRVSRTGAHEGPAEARPGALERDEALNRWARDLLVAEPAVDLVLLGHTHIPRRVVHGTGRYYLNSGDWLTHRTWIELREGQEPLLLEWTPEGPRPFNAVRRSGPETQD
jgi:UDP-2,3-diacylglucosamine hydrolase